MNSSTSSSEAPRAAADPEAASSEASSWRRFVAAFLLSGAALFAGLVGAVAALDPFDSGPLGQAYAGIADSAPRLAGASRARDPAFDAAVIGNSHIQLVDPVALSRGGRGAFVSLIVPGTGPREQLAVLDDFLRQHAGGVRALVFGLDPTWCTEDASLPMTNPFPFWLYEPGPLATLQGLVRFGALQQAARRIGLALGWTRPARRDGYWNYAEGRSPGYRPPGPATPEGEPVETAPAEDPAAEARRFPALDRLAGRLRALPETTAVLLVRPPVHASVLPRAGSDQARAEAACRAATLALARAHAATAVVDLRRDGPDARDSRLWFDDTHYAEPVARRAEAAIVAALGGLAGAARSPLAGP